MAMRRLNTSKSVFLLVAVMMVCVVCIVGCSGASYKLDRDKSLNTSWGTVFQYRVDDHWAEYKTDSSDKSEYSATARYVDEGKKKSNNLDIEVEDPKSPLKDISDDWTYGDWIDKWKETFSKSAQEQADWYRERLPSYGSEIDASHYPDYKDFSMTQYGTRTIGGAEFRLYKMEVTVSYSDAAYAYYKEEYPEDDIEQVSKDQTYYAVIKDDQHNAQISSKDERLLNDFLDTLQITW